METLFKKHFWIVIFLFLAFCAWLVAGSINQVIANKLRVIPSVTSATPANKTAIKKTAGAEDNQVVVRLNFFGSAMSQLQPTDADSTMSEEITMSSDEAQPSTMRANLVGTIVASDQKWSMAVIMDLTQSETNIYRVGDRLLEEAQITDIFSKRVYLLRGTTIEYLALQEKASPKAPGGSASHAIKPAQSSSSIGEGIKKLTDDKYVIQRKTIEDTLANLNTLAVQARIVPSIVNGESNGFMLKEVRPDSLYSKIGIQNDDVIQKINGFPMNSPDKALEIYQKLKSASSIDVELVRRGQVKKFTYQIQ